MKINLATALALALLFLITPGNAGGDGGVGKPQMEKVAFSIAGLTEVRAFLKERVVALWEGTSGCSGYRTSAGLRTAAHCRATLPPKTKIFFGAGDALVAPSHQFVSKMPQALEVHRGTLSPGTVAYTYCMVGENRRKMIVLRFVYAENEHLIFWVVPPPVSDTAEIKGGCSGAPVVAWSVSRSTWAVIGNLSGDGYNNEFQELEVEIAPEP